MNSVLKFYYFKIGPEQVVRVKDDIFQIKKMLSEEDSFPSCSVSPPPTLSITSPLLLPGSVRRNSTANSRGNGLSANHRIADRDYLGWMDFGRRSAEEYEYSS